MRSCSQSHRRSSCAKCRYSARRGLIRASAMGVMTAADAQLLEHYQDVCHDISITDALPVVYSTGYNTTFFGLEKLHPFDSCKFKKVHRSLTARSLISKTWEPCEAPKEVLRDVHDLDYLQQLHTSSRKVASVIELPPLAMLPMWLIQRMLLSNMRRHLAGTMLAAGLAVQHGWSLNLGGGMHHARHNDGDGWCAYSDITAAIRRIRVATGGRVHRVVVIDTDVHQGNGPARDKLHFQDDDLAIVDLYNAEIWPNDQAARGGITVERRLRCGCSSEAYIEALESALAELDASAFQAQLVIHNAGTDILDGDPLGRVCVSAEAVRQRDMLVWQKFRQLRVPITMLMSGGYTKQSAGVISDSLADIIQLEKRRGSTE
eukprot:jgi/Ulvmu1/4750/UM020_0034.1